VPTYEYACTTCGHRLEAVQSFSDDPLTECPECGAALRKVYSPVGIVLKGSGFYKTDSRAAAKTNGKTKSEDKSGADSSKGGDGGGGDSSSKSGGGDSSSKSGGGDSSSKSSNSSSSDAKSPATSSS
jgi:putative FmdB family regulatory protein